MERLNLYETNESECYFSFGYCCLTGAKFDNPFAMYNLGLMYKNGKASIKNLELARYWLEESLKKGFSLAKKKVIKFYIN